jgi:hypothetical protein
LLAPFLLPYLGSHMFPGFTNINPQLHHRLWYSHNDALLPALSSCDAPAAAACRLGAATCPLTPPSQLIACQSTLKTHKLLLPSLSSITWSWQHHSLLTYN